MAETCPQCQNVNYINHWWHNETANRWVCLGCGMDRNREYQKDQEPLRQYHESKHPFNPKIKPSKGG